MDNTIIIFLTALVPLIGILMAITPFFMPRSECFTVTIPEAAQADERIRMMKRIYLLAVLAVAGASTVLAAAFLPRLTSSEDPVALSLGYAAMTMVPLVVGFALMLVFRKKTQEIKRAEGWTADQQTAAALIGGSAPEPLNLKWYLLFVPVILASAGLTFALYPAMPEQLPLQVNLTGAVETSVAKTPLTASFPLFQELFLAIIFTICGWMITRSKRTIDPAKPATSAYAYGLFARTQSGALLAYGLILCAAIGLLFPLASANVITLMQAAVIITGVAVLIVIGVMWISLRYGQAGSRVFADAEAGNGIARDDDRHWKLGVFYVNSQDAAIIVPKRFGFGWTLNMASPKAWLLLAGLIAIVALFFFACITLF